MLSDEVALSELVADTMQHRCITLRMPDFNKDTCREPVGEICHEYPLAWRLSQTGRAVPVFTTGVKVQSYFVEQEPGRWFSTDWGLFEGEQQAVNQLETLREVLEDNAFCARGDCKLCGNGSDH
jgi:hypothetical protein